MQFRISAKHRNVKLSILDTSLHNILHVKLILNFTTDNAYLKIYTI